VTIVVLWAVLAARRARREARRVAGQALVAAELAWWLDGR
jgi:hypothetical protein